MADELHISSIVVQARPEAVGDIAHSIERIRGAEIHQRVGKTKLIVTLETGGTDEIMRHIKEINDLDGVISATLVYHHWETVGEAGSEADHGSDASQLSQG